MDFQDDVLYLGSGPHRMPGIPRFSFGILGAKHVSMESGECNPGWGVDPIHPLESVLLWHVVHKKTC